MLEGKTSLQRRQVIKSHLTNQKIPFHSHAYQSGENLIVSTRRSPYLAVSGHYDVVSGSPGANDNATSVAVIFELIDRFFTTPLKHIGVTFLLFDEEEKALQGSRAYVQDHHLSEMMGLINLEMLGQGDQWALWPLRPDEPGRLWEVFEEVCAESDIRTQRVNHVLHTGDHESFRMAGFGECFTLTAVSDRDLEVAFHFQKAREVGASPQTLMEILSKAPLFTHYHRETDLSVHLREEPLMEACDLIEKCIRRYDLPLDQLRSLGWAR